MASEPSPIASSTRGLQIASYGVLLVIGAIGLGFALSEMASGNDGPGALLLVVLFVSFPYALAAVASWLGRHSRPKAISLFGVWVLGGMVSVWALVDAIWLNPKFLSGLIVVVLPVIQIPVVAILTLVAWLAARSARRPPP